VIFACDRCGRRYSVPDERVEGRAFRVTCKSCGNVIVVRPGSAAPAASAPAQAAPRPVAPAASPARSVSDPFAPPAATPDAFAAGPTVEATRPAPQPAPMPRSPAGAPPAQPAPAPATVRDAERGLTAAEMAWMADDGSGRRPGPEPLLPEVEETEPDQPSDPAPTERKGPGIPRIVLAAVVLGAAAAVAVALIWPRWRSGPTPTPKPPAVVADAPAPPPAPPPAAPPPVVAVPEPAPPAATPSRPSASPPAAAPTHSRPGAHFEPGTVIVARVRRKEAHKLNRKDRKLLDLLARKHDQAAPPEPVEKLDLDTGRSLDPAAVERVMAESQGAFSGCVTRAAKAGGVPNADRATLLLTVARSGEVSTAWVAEVDLSRTRLGRCLVGAARRLIFPAFEGDPVDVSIPLVLEAR
jgi:predicted Zn finger-like uncharacterized protein